MKRSYTARQKVMAGGIGLISAGVVVTMLAVQNQTQVHQVQEGMHAHDKDKGVSLQALGSSALMMENDQPASPQVQAGMNAIHNDHPASPQVQAGMSAIHNDHPASPQALVAVIIKPIIAPKTDEHTSESSNHITQETTSASLVSSFTSTSIDDLLYASPPPRKPEPYDQSDRTSEFDLVSYISEGTDDGTSSVISSDVSMETSALQALRTKADMLHDTKLNAAKIIENFQKNGRYQHADRELTKLIALEAARFGPRELKKRLFLISKSRSPSPNKIRGRSRSRSPNVLQRLARKVTTVTRRRFSSKSNARGDEDYVQLEELPPEYKDYNEPL